MTDASGAADLRPLQVEMNGINVIAENERKGHPRDLFWPWFAANISVLALSRAAFGVNGNTLPTVVSWLLTVGWE